MSPPQARAARKEGERAETPVDSRARFTARGWGFLAAGALCLVLATWLGRKDVLALALFLGSSPLFATLSLYVVKPRVQLKRTVDPALVTVGDSAAVRLRVRHRTRRGAAAHGFVSVHETVPAPLGEDRELSVAAGSEPAGYTVRPRRRGVWTLGPATVQVADPFGLATELLDVSERTSLHVAPDAVELPEISADRLRGGGTDPSRTALPQPGPDNVTTREYRHGDPLRRVHWAASAKQDRLMVRQEEPRSTRRTVLVLDLDERSWPGERLWAGVLPSTTEFEWAVGLVAALLEHLTQRDTAVHLLDGFGRPLPMGGADDDASVARRTAAAVTDDTAEDARHGLARVRPVPAPVPGDADGSRGRNVSRDAGAADPLADRLAQERLVHPLLLVSGDLGREVAERFVRAAPRAAAGNAVLVASAPDRGPEGAGVLEAAGWSVVVVPADAAPEDAWARLGARTAGAAR